MVFAITLLTFPSVIIVFRTIPSVNNVFLKPRSKPSIYIAVSDLDNVDYYFKKKLNRKIYSLKSRDSDSGKQ